MKTRRSFITLLGGAATAWPVVARGQQKRLPRIGILLGSGPEPMGPFLEALSDLGYVENRNIEIEVRNAQGKAERLPELAAELVRARVDIIVASFTPAVVAAKNATRDIPIVMAPAGDPIGTGLVESLARPGGNVTGLSATSAELAAKGLELVREISPVARRIGVLSNATDPFAKSFLEQIQRGAQPMRFDVQSIMIGGNDKLDDVFVTLARERADAVIFQSNLPFRSIVDLAVKYRIPALSNQKFVAQAGALVSYSASFKERARQIAGYVDVIIKGAKPADLPVQQPSTFELVINLKTARALGLTVPPSLLARADEVIE